MHEGRLAIDRSGGGQPLLLVHGIGSNRHIWKPVVPLLEPEHDVVAVDVPGFGDSPPMPAGTTPTIPALAGALASELDALGLGAVHVAGNSMGGWLAIELARLGRARSVVAISPAGGWTRAEARQGKMQLRAMRGGSKALAPLGELPFKASAARRALLWMVAAHGERLPPAEAARATASMANASGWRPTLDWMNAHEVEPLPDPGCPVLVAWGDRDRLLRPRQGPRLVARIGGAELRVLPGLGHAPTYDDPDVVAATILEVTRRATSP